MINTIFVKKRLDFRGFTSYSTCPHKVVVGKLTFCLTPRIMFIYIVVLIICLKATFIRLNNSLFCA